MKIMRILARLFFVIALGTMIGVVLVEDELWVRNWVQEWFNDFFSQMYVCTFDSRIELLHLLSGKIAIRDLHAQDPYGHWEWKAEHGLVSFSLIDLLRYGSIRLCIVLDDCAVKTQVNRNGISIVPHFALMAQPAQESELVPIIVAQIKIRNASVYGQWPGSDYTVYAYGACNLDTTVDSFKSSVLIRKAAIKKAQKDIVVSDAITFESASDFDPFGTDCASLGAYCVFPSMPAHVRAVTASVQRDKDGMHIVCKSSGSQSDSKEGLYVDVAFDSKANAFTSWSVPVDFIRRLFFLFRGRDCSVADCDQNCSAGCFSGSCLCDTDWMDRTLDCSARISGLSLYGYQVPDCFFVSKPLDGGRGLEGSVSLGCCDDACASVDWEYALGDVQNDSCLSCNVRLLREIGLPYQWYIVPGQTKLSGAYQYKRDMLRGSYCVQACRDVTAGQKKMACATGVVQGSAQRVFCSGVFADQPYKVVLDTQPNFSVCHCSWGDDIVLSHDGNTFSFSCNYTVIADVLQRLGYSVPGVGICTCSGFVCGSHVTCHCSCSDASIRVPGTYNVVTGVSGTVVGDYERGEYTIEDACVSLHEGSVSVPHGSVVLDGFRPSFVHVPLVCSSCFVNYGKDIFARVSGALTLVYRDGRWRCCGLCSVDESHMRANLLSQDFQLWKSSVYAPRDSVLSGLDLDVAVCTREPLHVATSFLDGDIAADVRVGGTLEIPALRGCVQFLHGTLKFPYAPLFITDGSLAFDADDVQQSLISLRAENSVKKYSVRIDVSGTLDDPIIHFDSSPLLEKEQIITLLLGGSEDGALYFVMPKMLTETLENLVFGSKDTVSVAQRSIRKFFKPFRNVWLIPSLSDQTGRGGLKGSVVIEVSERLKAIIEKNFSKPEATSVEIEYFLADEVDLKIFKDSWGDFGAEVEMRYGFGN